MIDFARRFLLWIIDPFALAATLAFVLLLMALQPSSAWVALTFFLLGYILGLLRKFYD